MPAFRDAWMSIGDSIVVVGGEGLWNCHIHTNDIGGAIEAAVDCGRPRAIRVTDLHEQVEEERWVRDAPPVDEVAVVHEEVTTAVVAVATPTISRVADQTIAPGQPVTVSVTVGDPVAAASSLTLSWSAGSPGLFQSVTLGGTGASRTVTLVPWADQTGETAVYLTVANPSGGQASTTFRISVQRPTVTPTAPATVRTGGGVRPGEGEQGEQREITPPTHFRPPSLGRGCGVNCEFNLNRGDLPPRLVPPVF